MLQFTSTFPKAHLLSVKFSIPGIITYSTIYILFISATICSTTCFMSHILTQRDKLRWKDQLLIRLHCIVIAKVTLLCVFTITVPTELRTEPDDEMFISYDCTHVFSLFSSLLLHRSTRHHSLFSTFSLCFIRHHYTYYTFTTLSNALSENFLRESVANDKQTLVALVKLLHFLMSETFLSRLTLT